MSIICPNCSADLPDDAVFCDQCGSSLSAPAPSKSVAPAASAGEEVCSQCGNPIIPGEAFCDNCGASLQGPKVADVAVEPVLAPVAEPVVPPSAPAPKALPDLVQCPSCGADNLPGSKFCSNCGILMSTPAAVAEPAPVVEPIPAAEPVPVAEPAPAAESEAEPEEDIQPEPVQEPAPVVVDDLPPATGKLRFVVRDTGAEIPLPADEGEFIIGREDPVSGVYPEIDLNPHDGEFHGVSRRHAKLIIDAGLVFIEDLDSTNFTFVDRQKLAPNTPTALSNGDEVRIGKLVLTYLA